MVYNARNRMTRAPDGNNGQDESISALLAQSSHGKREVEERLIPPINETWVRLVEQPEVLGAENNSIDVLALREVTERLKERDWQMARAWPRDELSKKP
jgi:hypothetical protein